MRQRTTFLHNAEDPFEPRQLLVTNETLTVSALAAAREDRFTFALPELPQELWTVLKQFHELHIRWSSSRPYPCMNPFAARTAPGLHLFFTPQKGKQVPSFCPLFEKLFGLPPQCSTPEEISTPLPVSSERFTASAALQYYHALPSLDGLALYLKEKICPSLGGECFEKADDLPSLDYLDIDFDRISHTFVLTAFRARPPSSYVWDETIRSNAKETVEIGILANEKAVEPEELSLGGFLTLLGESDKADPTLFSFPSRHHCSNSGYSVTFPSPAGLHPALSITFSQVPNPPPVRSECSLHAYATLPSTVFFDRYQFSDPLLLKSKHIKALKVLYGEADLEAPDWDVQRWGSAALFELTFPSRQHPAIDSLAGVEPWTVELPVHLRYLSPASNGSISIDVPWPVLFWACTAEEGTKMPVNPFDRLNLGYDGLFGPRTMFYHLTPEPEMTDRGASVTARLNVPVMDLGRTAWVEWGTGVILFIGFLVTARAILGAMYKGGRESVDLRKKRV